MTEALNRKLWISLAVLLALVLLTRGGSMFSQRQSRTSLAGFSVAHIAEMDVAALTIHEGTRTTEFRHDPQAGWFVSGKKADDERVAGLFEIFASTTVQEIASRNSESHANFGLDEQKGIIVSVTMRDAREESYMIGDEGRSGQTFYAKRSGDDTVYLLSGNLRSTLMEHVDYWRDKRIVEIGKDDVTSVEIVRPSGKTVLTKTADGWIREENSASQDTDAAEMDRFLSALSPLKAVSFANEDQQTSFSEEELKTHVSVQAQDEAHEFDAAYIDGSWWMTIQGSNETFEIDTLTARNLLLGIPDSSSSEL